MRSVLLVFALCLLCICTAQFTTIKNVLSGTGAYRQLIPDVQKRRAVIFEPERYFVSLTLINIDTSESSSQLSVEGQLANMPFIDSANDLLYFFAIYNGNSTLHSVHLKFGALSLVSRVATPKVPLSQTCVVYDPPSQLLFIMGVDGNTSALFNVHSKNYTTIRLASNDGDDCVYDPSTRLIWTVNRIIKPTAIYFHQIDMKESQPFPYLTAYMGITSTTIVLAVDSVNKFIYLAANTILKTSTIYRIKMDGTSNAGVNVGGTINSVVTGVPSRPSLPVVFGSLGTFYAAAVDFSAMTLANLTANSTTISTDNLKFAFYDSLSTTNNVFAINSHGDLLLLQMADNLPSWGPSDANSGSSALFVSWMLGTLLLVLFVTWS
jgi:hypothetical protein